MSQPASLRLHILSDLHLDACPIPWRAPRTDADVLVLAGDLYDDSERTMDWCEQARADTGKPVIFVPGNHDLYGGVLQDSIQQMRERADRAGVHMLHNDSVVIGGVRFVGATLWTDYCAEGPGLRGLAMHAAERFMRDFQRITYRSGNLVWPMSPEHALEEHRAALLAIQEAIDDAYTEPVVVITHHAPLVESLDPKFRGSALNPCMASDLDDLVRYSMARLWVHGHIHQSVDVMCGSTRVVCNPRGYTDTANLKFDPSLVLVV